MSTLEVCACNNDSPLILGIFIGILCMNVLFITYRLSIPQLTKSQLEEVFPQFKSVGLIEPFGFKKENDTPIVSWNLNPKDSINPTDLKPTLIFPKNSYVRHPIDKKETTPFKIPVDKSPINLMSSKSGNRYMTNTEMQDIGDDFYKSTTLTDDEIEKIANL